MPGHFGLAISHFFLLGTGYFCIVIDILILCPGTPFSYLETIRARTRTVFRLGWIFPLLLRKDPFYYSNQPPPPMSGLLTLVLETGTSSWPCVGPCAVPLILMDDPFPGFWPFLHRHTLISTPLNTQRGPPVDPQSSLLSGSAMQTPAALVSLKPQCRVFKSGRWWNAAQHPLQQPGASAWAAG